MQYAHANCNVAIRYYVTLRKLQMSGMWQQLDCVRSQCDAVTLNCSLLLTSLNKSLLIHSNVSKLSKDYVCLNI